MGKIPYRRYFYGSIPILLIVWFISALGASEKTSKEPNDKVKEIHFFYTGELLGELEPCGCSGVKLGGLQQRSGWIKSLSQKLGSLFLVDGGFAPLKTGLQTELKQETYKKILEQLQYNYHYLEKNEPLRIISSEIGPILFFSFSEEKTFSSEIENLLKKEKKLLPKVLFILGRKITSATFSSFPQGNFFRVFLDVAAPEPKQAVVVDSQTIFLTPGNRGRYAGLLKLSLSSSKITWENQNIALTDKHPSRKETTLAFDDYLEQVKEKKLLDLVIKKSSPMGFIGSETCSMCHTLEYEKWNESLHAHAFDTLVKVKRQYDPDCVSCHVVGYEFEEGFRNLEESDYLIHVGCESCHGPGANHFSNPSASYGKTQGAQSCAACHHPDHSPDFDYPSYREKIKHWR